MLTARAAADRGAAVSTRTRCLSATREDGAWTLLLQDVRTGARRELRARALVNAAGPWVAEVLRTVLRSNAPSAVRLVQGSHVVVPRLYEHDRCYIFQNADNRIFFAIPYEQDFTLVGTTDHDYKGDPAGVHATEDEIDYICRAATSYFVKPVTPADVVWSYSGVRPLYDDGATAAQEATRDYVLELDAPGGEAAVLSVFGGKITTYRRLAEAALARLAPHMPPGTGAAAGSTAKACLPGGNFAVEAFDAEVAGLQARYPFLPPRLAHRLVRAYGTKARLLLGDAKSMPDLGRVLGADLTEAEVAYLAREEWAEAADDVVWRRSKLGLRMTPAEIAGVGAALDGLRARQAA